MNHVKHSVLHPFLVLQGSSQAVCQKPLFYINEIIFSFDFYLFFQVPQAYQADKISVFLSFIELFPAFIDAKLKLSWLINFSASSS